MEMMSCCLSNIADFRSSRVLTVSVALKGYADDESMVQMTADSTHAANSRSLPLDGSDRFTKGFSEHVSLCIYLACLVALTRLRVLPKELGSANDCPDGTKWMSMLINRVDSLIDAKIMCVGRLIENIVWFPRLFHDFSISTA
jgi:hypothetical protein